MDIPEALAELAIGADATAEQLRRAYLRKLKLHKPEVDPEGFRRLREAYERVLSAIAFGVLRASDDPSQSQKEVPAQGPENPAANGNPADSTARACDEQFLWDAADSRPANPSAPAQAPIDEFWTAYWNQDLRAAAEAAFRLLEMAPKTAYGSAPILPLVQVKLWLYARGDFFTAQRLGMSLAKNYEAIQNGPLSGAAAVHWQMGREVDLLGELFPESILRTIAEAVYSEKIEEGLSALALQAKRNPEQARIAAELLSQRAPGLHAVFGRALAASQKRSLWTARPLGIFVLLAGARIILGYSSMCEPDTLRPVTPRVEQSTPNDDWQKRGEWLVDPSKPIAVQNSGMNGIDSGFKVSAMPPIASSKVAGSSASAVSSAHRIWASVQLASALARDADQKALPALAASIRQLELALLQNDCKAALDQASKLTRALSQGGGALQDEIKPYRALIDEVFTLCKEPK